MAEWESEAITHDLTRAEFFLRHACELLDNMNMGYGLADLQPGYYNTSTNAGNIYTLIDGFYFDESENMLTLVLCDFSTSDTLEKLTKTEYETQIKRTERFYHDIIAGKYNKIDPSRDVFQLINLLVKQKKFTESTGQLNLHLITNKLAPITLPENKTLPSGCNVSYRLSDFETLSSADPQSVLIDFSEYQDKEYSAGLPFLSANTDPKADFFESYLLVFPAEVLVKSYDSYRARLLEQNVRVYLQKKGKINKGIHETIKKKPQVFFIYNNGLSITADKIDLSEDGTRITRIHGLKVVNGGQTMASLHHAWKEGNDVSSITVQAKLTVVSKNITEVIVPYISRYSNSQNAIKDTDQHSNDIIQIKLEKYSTKIKSPVGRATTWFYERMRGQYDNAQLHLTAAQKKHFQDLNPKSQLVKPTDFAKVIMTFEMMPYLVVQGAQKAFNGTGGAKGFCDYASLVYGINPGYITSETWYIESMGKFILVKEAQKIVKEVIKKEKEELKSFSASITTYTVATLVHLLYEMSMSINARRIWEKQSIDRTLTHNIQIVAKKVLLIISKHPDHSEWLKKSYNWDEVKQTVADAQLAIHTDGPFYLMHRPVLITKMAENRINPPDDLTTNQRKVLLYRPDVYWAELNDWVETTHYKLTSSQEKLLVKRLKNHKLTDKQCRDLLSLVEEVKTNGWMQPFIPEEHVNSDSIHSEILPKNPVSTFLRTYNYDVLFLERSCDMLGGSRYIDELFEEYPFIKDMEEMRHKQNELEIGSIVPYKINTSKIVVLGYTKKTKNSVPYPPIIEVCLQKLAVEHNGKKILTTYIGCETTSPEDRLQHPEIKKLFEKTLYNQDLTIAIEL